MTPPRLTAVEMLARLVAFDTVSADENDTTSSEAVSVTLFVVGTASAVKPNVADVIPAGTVTDAGIVPAPLAGSWTSATLVSPSAGRSSVTVNARVVPANTVGVAGDRLANRGIRVPTCTWVDSETLSSRALTQPFAPSRAPAVNVKLTELCPVGTTTSTGTEP